MKVVRNLRNEVDSVDAVRRFVTELYRDNKNKEFLMLTNKGSFMDKIFSDPKFNGIVDIKYAEDFTRTRKRVNHQTLVDEFLKVCIKEKKALILDNIMETMRFSDQGYSSEKGRLGGRAQDVFSSLRYYDLNMFIIYDRKKLQDMFTNEIGKLITRSRNAFSNKYSGTKSDSNLIKHLCFDYLYDTYYLNKTENKIIFPESALDKGVNSYLSLNLDFGTNNMTFDRKGDEYESPLFDNLMDRNLGLPYDQTVIDRMLGGVRVEEAPVEVEEFEYTLGEVVDEIPSKEARRVKAEISNFVPAEDVTIDPRYTILKNYDNVNVKEILHNLLDDNLFRTIMDKYHLNMLGLAYCLYTKYMLDFKEDFGRHIQDEEELRSISIKSLVSPDVGFSYKVSQNMFGTRFFTLQNELLKVEDKKGEVYLMDLDTGKSQEEIYETGFLY